MILSPHFGSWQVGRHGASGFAEFMEPASHCSLNALSTTPSPQRGILQSCWQVSPSSVLPSSHCSPFAGSTTLFPHVSFDRQSAEQPSPDVLLPSSHASPALRMPLPQPAGRHTPLVHSPATVVPLMFVYEQEPASATPRHALSCAGNTQPPLSPQTSSPGQSTSGQCVNLGDVQATTSNSSRYAWRPTRNSVYVYCVRFAVSTCACVLVIAACRDAEQRPSSSSSSAVPSATASGRPKGPAPTLPDQVGTAGAEELQKAFDAEAPDPERKQKGELELRPLAMRLSHGEPPQVECRATRCRLWLAGSDDELREAIDAVRAQGAYDVQVATPEPRSDGKWLVQVFLHAH